MFYTVTFNPCIDYVVGVDGFTLGETNRSVYEEIQFGGKGINVSYILRELGVESVALGFVAGFTGKALLKQMSDDGIKNDFIELVSGNTRINIKLKSGVETEINASGPMIPKAQINELFEKLKTLNSGDTLVLSGSVPKCLADDIYGKIAEAVSLKGVRTVVDATGDLLKNTLKYKPFLIKPNLRELEQLSGRELKTVDDIKAAALELKELGAQNVLVSMGADGALLIDGDGKVFFEAAFGGKPKNTVGAGDSMLAGFMAGIEKGSEFALKLGLAAGGATACSERLATKKDIFSLLNAD